MTWIRTISYSDAVGRLKTLYDHIKGPNDNVDNIMMAHSLRPHTMEGHLAIYKNVLHHNANTLPKWFMECIGVYVSLMNGCDYCAKHHFEGMRRLLKDDERARALRDALVAHAFEDAFDHKERAALHYAEKLTQNPTDMEEYDVLALREAGYDDGEILEINQIVSYFSYANRMVQGLGVSIEGDVLGLSPSSDNPDDLSHR